MVNELLSEKTIQHIKVKRESCTISEEQSLLVTTSIIVGQAVFDLGVLMGSEWTMNFLKEFTRLRALSSDQIDACHDFFVELGEIDSL